MYLTGLCRKNSIMDNALMVNDKSFGIVSQELMFSILHDCAVN